MNRNFTSEEIAHLCSTITPAQREFCAAHMNFATWPELWLSDMPVESGCGSFVDVAPFSTDYWWEIINERVVTPGDSSTDTAQ